MWWLNFILSTPRLLQPHLLNMCWRHSVSAKEGLANYSKKPRVRILQSFEKYSIWLDRHLLFQVVFCLPTYLLISSPFRKHKSTFSFSIILTTFSVTERFQKCLCQLTATSSLNMPEPALSLLPLSGRQPLPSPSFLKTWFSNAKIFYNSIPKFIIL